MTRNRPPRRSSRVVLRAGGRLIVGDLGQPEDLLTRLAVRTTAQRLDAVATTALNVRGGLKEVLRVAGFSAVKVRDPIGTPTGS